MAKTKGKSETTDRHRCTQIFESNKMAVILYLSVFIRVNLWLIILKNPSVSVTKI